MGSENGSDYERKAPFWRWYFNTAKKDCSTSVSVRSPQKFTVTLAGEFRDLSDADKDALGERIKTIAKDKLGNGAEATVIIVDGSIKANITVQNPPDEVSVTTELLGQALENEFTVNQGDEVATVYSIKDPIETVEQFQSVEVDDGSGDDELIASFTPKEEETLLCDTIPYPKVELTFRKNEQEWIEWFDRNYETPGAAFSTAYENAIQMKTLDYPSTVVLQSIGKSVLTFFVGRSDGQEGRREQLRPDNSRKRTLFNDRFEPTFLTNARNSADTVLGRARVQKLEEWCEAGGGFRAQIATPEAFATAGTLLSGADAAFFFFPRLSQVIIADDLSSEYFVTVGAKYPGETELQWQQRIDAATVIVTPVRESDEIEFRVQVKKLTMRIPRLPEDNGWPFEEVLGVNRDELGFARPPNYSFVEMFVRKQWQFHKSTLLQPNSPPLSDGAGAGANSSDSFPTENPVSENPDIITVTAVPDTGFSVLNAAIGNFNTFLNDTPQVAIIASPSSFYSPSSSLPYRVWPSSSFTPRGDFYGDLVGADSFGPSDYAYLELRRAVREIFGATNAGHPFYDSVRSWSPKYPSMFNWDTSSVTKMDYLFSNEDLQLGTRQRAFVNGPAILNTGNFGYVELTDDKLELSTGTQVAVFRFSSSSSGDSNNGGWVTKNVVSMVGMFDGWKGFTSQIKSLNSDALKNVKNTNNMFRGCTSLKKAPELGNLTSVISANSMFENCYILEDPDRHSEKYFPRFPAAAADQPPLQFCNSMFANCRKFDADLGSWSMKSVSDFSRMFLGCRMFKGVGLDKVGWTGGEFGREGEGCNMKSMFSGCYRLDVDMTNWKTSFVTDMSYMFRSAGVIRGGDQEMPRGVENWNTNMVTDMTSMFESATKLSSASFNGQPGNWNTSKVRSMGRMFCNASNFEGNGLDKWDTSQVERMDGMFQGTRIKGNNLGEWDTRDVVDMSNMFYNTEGLEGDGIGYWDVRNVVTMKAMFTDSPEYTGQGIGAWKTQSLQNIRDMFSGAVKFREDISSWDVKNIGREGGFDSPGMIAETDALIESNQQLIDSLQSSLDKQETAREQAVQEIREALGDLTLGVQEQKLFQLAQDRINQYSDTIAKNTFLKNTQRFGAVEYSTGGGRLGERKSSDCFRDVFENTGTYAATIDIDSAIDDEKIKTDYGMDLLCTSSRIYRMWDEQIPRGLVLDTELPGGIAWPRFFDDFELEPALAATLRLTCDDKILVSSVIRILRNRGLVLGNDDSPQVKRAYEIMGNAASERAGVLTSITSIQILSRKEAPSPSPRGLVFRGVSDADRKNRIFRETIEKANIPVPLQRQQDGSLVGVNTIADLTRRELDYDDKRYHSSSWLYNFFVRRDDEDDDDIFDRDLPFVSASAQAPAGQKLTFLEDYQNGIKELGSLSTDSNREETAYFYIGGLTSQAIDPKFPLDKGSGDGITSVKQQWMDEGVRELPVGPEWELVRVAYYDPETALTADDHIKVLDMSNAKVTVNFGFQPTNSVTLTGIEANYVSELAVLEFVKENRRTLFNPVPTDPPSRLFPEDDNDLIYASMAAVGERLEQAILTFFPDVGHLSITDLQPNLQRLWSMYRNYREQVHQPRRIDAANIKGEGSSVEFRVTRREDKGYLTNSEFNQSDQNGFEREYIYVYARHSGVNITPEETNDITYNSADEVPSELGSVSAGDIAIPVDDIAIPVDDIAIPVDDDDDIAAVTDGVLADALAPIEIVIEDSEVNPLVAERDQRYEERVKRNIIKSIEIEVPIRTYPTSGGKPSTCCFSQATSPPSAKTLSINGIAIVPGKGYGHMFSSQTAYDNAVARWDNAGEDERKKLRLKYGEKSQWRSVQVFLE